MCSAFGDDKALQCLSGIKCQDKYKIMKINHLIKNITDCNGVPRAVLGSEKSVVNSTEKAPLLMVPTNYSRKRHGSSKPPSK